MEFSINCILLLKNQNNLLKILKNRKALTVSLLFLLIACERKEPGEECSEYPKQIDSLQVRDLYDTARLYLFTWLCDRQIDSYYRGQFELKYKAFYLQNDSLELFFSHSLPKELQNSTTASEYIHKTSMAFNIKTKQKLWGWDINGFSDALRPDEERFNNPLTNDVQAFIKTHRSILNPCFLALLKKTNLLVK